MKRLTYSCYEKEGGIERTRGGERENHKKERKKMFHKPFRIKSNTATKNSERYRGVVTFIYVVVLTQVHTLTHIRMHTHTYAHTHSYIRTHTLDNRKRLKREIASHFPDLFQHQLDGLIPNKSTIATVKVLTHGGTNVTVTVVDKEPIMFESEGVLCPTGKEYKCKIESVYS